MSSHKDFSRLGFFRTVVVPSLLIFLVPVLSWMFFLHAQATFDTNIRTALIRQLEADPSIPGPERVATIDKFAETPFSQILITDEDFASTINSELRGQYAVFRWMIRLSKWSVFAGIFVFVFVGLCVLLSLRSQFVQYLSFLIGWHTLRLYGAVQTIVIGVLLVALSYWVSALWWDVYSKRVIVIATVFAIGGAAAVLVSIFRRPAEEGALEGKILERQSSPELWKQIDPICVSVGVDPPDWVVAGIEDAFFVTETSIIVEAKRLRGKTLFLSLPLLKQLHTSEADAILAHEMAHFSGEDTWYSRRISPLLHRYDDYLHSLKEGGTGIVVFYYMACFRALFEISLCRLSRHREFRADGIAARVTTPSDFAAALLRIVSYSRFRATVEQELFSQSRVMESADVSSRVEAGYLDYVARFAKDPDLGSMESAHPFDTHPSLSQRLKRIGIELTSDSAQSLLERPGDGGWYQVIPNAAEIEQQMWKVYEDQFRVTHEQSLPYRFLPATPEEQAIVEQAFPVMNFYSADGNVTIDFEKVVHARWSAPIRFSEITGMTAMYQDFADDEVLEIHYKRIGKSSRQIKLAGFGAEQKGVLKAVLEKYYGRYLAAVKYQQEHSNAT